MGDVENSSFYLIFKGEIEISIPNPSKGNNSMFKNVLKVRKKLRLSA